MKRRNRKPSDYSYLRVNFNSAIDKDMILWLLDGKLLLDQPPARAKKKLYRVLLPIMRTEQEKEKQEDNK